MQIIIMVVLFGGMFFMMNRSQKKQRDARTQMVDNMQPGARVVTIGRMHGVVESVNKADKTFVLDADGVYFTFDLDGVARVVPAESSVEAATTDEPVEVDAEITDVDTDATSDIASGEDNK
ncbi:preprotein translocase subunit YajC [Periweissella cryptocerci]|nr:preprotein translocase subunit YajC [Periweissella cryptocerci]